MFEGMPRADALDRVVFATLAVLSLLVMPIVVGRFLTPVWDGEPVRLNGQVLAEQQYIGEARRGLATVARAHNTLADLPLVESITGGDAFRYSKVMESLAGELDALRADLEKTDPPGRFISLHARLVALVNLYRLAVGDAWAYYGDLDERHLQVIGEGLAEGQLEVRQLEALLTELDYQRAQDAADRYAPQPTPTLLPSLPTLDLESP